MHFNILTIFPDFFESCLRVSLLGKAIAEKKISVSLHNIRDFCADQHSQVDDVPYGGGPGMVMKPEPIVECVESIPRKKKSLCVLLTPRGRLFSQELVCAWSHLDQLLLICGRYEGIDERVCELAADQEVSVGDYVLSGGETAALVILDTLVRLLPGVIGNAASLTQESFAQGILEYPQYTRPPEYRGLKVPKVLQSGHHGEIEKWRHQQALRQTQKRRPDLLPKTLIKGLQKRVK